MTNKTKALNLLLASVTFSTSAFAYDFDKFQPTLDTLHQSGQSAIDSGYSLVFKKVSDSTDYDFVYQDLTDNNATVPVYYKIDYTFDGGTTGAQTFGKTTNTAARDEISGYFQGVTSTYYGSPAALYNTSGNNEVKAVNADFINNKTNIGSYSNAFGGALANGATNAYTEGTIGKISGDFIGNSAIRTGTAQAGGGAIFNKGTIKEISGAFINNHTDGYQSVGGAIININIIGNINAVFIGNHAIGTIARGGGIYNSTGTYNTGQTMGGLPMVPLIASDFIGNYLKASDNAMGGAIYNIAGNNAVVPDIRGNFIGNYAYGDKHARAGAIDAVEGISTITGNFIGNYAESKNSNSYAGAIYTENDVRFVAGGLNNYFTGNYVKDVNGKIYNAIYIGGTKSPKLTFDITNGGNLYFNDSIMSHNSDGYFYDVEILGYGTGKFFMNNYIQHAGSVEVKDAMLIFNKAPYTDDSGCGNDCHGQFVAKIKNDKVTPNTDADAVTSLSLNNGQFYLYNRYTENVKLKNYAAIGDSLLHIDVTKENGEWVADKLSISGQTEGTTQVVVYDRTNEDNRGASVLFIEAPNDTNSAEKTPSVFRVYGSPYKWDIAYNYKGETSGSYWYLVGSETPNDSSYVAFVPEPIEIDDSFALPEPDPTKQPVNPEITAYHGLHAASLEQTLSMVTNIRDHAAADKFALPGCGSVYDEAWNGKELHNVWAAPVYHTATIKKPVHTKADIWGLEAGFDLQSDINNKLGVFGSYRKGSYDVDGRQSLLYSQIGAEIDIDSYIAGLYYRYDYNRFWLFATVYGGLQQADVKSDDGGNGDSDALQLGGSLEAGYLYALNETLRLEPSLGISYTQADFDDINDNYGQKASYKTIGLSEIEAGIKLEKYIPTDGGIAKAYIKPSIVQVATKGANVVIGGLGKVSSYDEGTLGRIEIGGRYAIRENLSALIWANYSFGSQYYASSAGLGLNYSW